MIRKLTVVFVITALGGAGFIWQRQKDTAVKIEPDNEVRIFMGTAASDSHRRAVRAELEKLEEAGTIKYWRYMSKEDSYEEFRDLVRKHPDDPRYRDSFTGLRVSDLPDSYRFVYARPTAKEVARSFEKFGGVRAVTLPKSPAGSSSIFSAMKRGTTVLKNFPLHFVANIYLRLDVSEQERNAIETDLIELHKEGVILDWEYVDKDQTYREYLQYFPNQPELTEGVTKEDLPTSYVLRYDRFRKAPDFKRLFEGRPGVEQVLVVDGSQSEGRVAS